jgi:hypothetical protein
MENDGFPAPLIADKLFTDDRKAFCGLYCPMKYFSKNSNFDALSEIGIIRRTE